MREVVIVSAVRTAIGSFGGALKDVTPMVSIQKKLMKLYLVVYFNQDMDRGLLDNQH
jgi:hypothetical protein